jgi:hypothetical protein
VNVSNPLFALLSLLSFVMTEHTFLDDMVLLKLRETKVYSFIK